MSHHPTRSTRACRPGSVIPLLAAILLAAPAAQSGVFELQPDASGEDTSPYSFIPSLIRGNYPTMYALTSQDPDGTVHDQISYLKFELPPDLLQPGETVIAASLFMVFSYTFSHDGSPPPPGGELYVHEVAQPWDEQTMSWNTKPAFGPPVAEALGIDAFGAIELDVTRTVAFWAHGDTPNHGFAVTNPTDVPIGFHTWETNEPAALKNSLVIVTGPGAPPVPVLSPWLALGTAGGLAALGLRVLRRQSSSE